MTPRLNSVDMSKWGGELTAQESADIWALGIHNIKVGDGWPGKGGAGEWSRQQGESWLAVNGEKGATLDAYIYLYMAGDPIQAVDTAMQTLAGVPVRFWWLDAEDVDSPELTPGQRETFLRTCVEEVVARGGKVGIYTAHWWWPDKMANSTMFERLPLWNSWYDGDPDEDGLPYGGWEHSAVEQYDDTQLIGGQSVDINYDSTLDTEDEMSPTEKEEHAALVALFGGRKRLLDVTSPAKGMDYLLGYGREQAKLGVVIAATGTQAEAEAAACAYQKEYNS